MSRTIFKIICKTFKLAGPGSQSPRLRPTSAARTYEHLSLSGLWNLTPDVLKKSLALNAKPLAIKAC